jgi:phosphoribosyl 1,2-cyclic phosphodiesterase
MRVTFWGVRGSVPWATAETVGYGCNTPCLEIRDDASGAVLILDAGTGIAGLGMALGKTPRPVDILLSHYHWDHVQGLPFFAPFFSPGWAPRLWAPRLAEWTGAALHGLFAPPFFPKPFGELASSTAITTVDVGELRIGGFHVEAHPLAHPGGAFAYRIRCGGGDLVYATDHEFGNLDIDDGLAAFAQNAAAVIYDAHLTPEESPQHAGWGHSNWHQCADFASAAGAGHLWLFHHKPGRSDADVTDIEARARRVFPATTAAREGASFSI